MVNSKIIPSAAHILSTYILRRRSAPFLASFKPTYRCNLRCLQCPFHGLPGEDISFHKARMVMDQLRARGNRIMIFEGGEPMLWRDGQRTINDLAVEARKRFYCVGMTTNGTYPLNAPVDIIWVSIDGFASTHNYLRGKEIFDQVIGNIRQSSHPRIYAHITVNSKNYTETLDLISYLAKWVKGITLQFLYPYHQQSELFLDTEKRSLLLDQLIKLKRKGRPILNSIPSLESLKHNSWKCADWLVDNANPDATLIQGCYLRGRADIDCTRCGFSPYSEISLAHHGNIRSILTGIKIFYS